MVHVNCFHAASIPSPSAVTDVITCSVVTTTVGKAILFIYTHAFTSITL